MSQHTILCENCKNCILTSSQHRDIVIKDSLGEEHTRWTPIGSLCKLLNLYMVDVQECSEFEAIEK